MSDYLTSGVMDYDSSPGRLAPPQTAPTTSRVGPPTLVKASEREIQGYLERMLGEAAAPSCSLQELAGDGSPSISSMVAVWLFSQVGSIVDKPKLVNLASIQGADLRSMAGVARVLRGALDAVSSNTASQ